MKTGNTARPIHEILFRAKRADTKEWVEGYYYAAVSMTHAQAESLDGACRQNLQAPEKPEA